MPRLTKEEIAAMRQQSRIGAQQPSAPMAPPDQGAPPNSNPFMAGLENFGRGASMGLTPMINAGIQSVGTKAQGMMDPNLADDRPLSQMIMDNLGSEQNKFRQYSQNAPIASTLGGVAGGFAGGMATGGLPKLAQGALMGTDVANDVMLNSELGNMGDMAMNAAIAIPAAVGGQALGRTFAPDIGVGLSKAGQYLDNKSAVLREGAEGLVEQFKAKANKAYGEAFGLPENIVGPGGRYFRNRGELGPLTGKVGRAEIADEAFGEAQSGLAGFYNKNPRVAEANNVRQDIFAKEGLSPRENAARVERDTRAMEGGVYKEFKPANDAYRFTREAQKGVADQTGLGRPSFSGVDAALGIMAPKALAVKKGAELGWSAVENVAPSAKAWSRDKLAQGAEKAFQVLLSNPTAFGGKAGKLLQDAASRGPQAFRAAYEELVVNGNNTFVRQLMEEDDAR